MEKKGKEEKLENLKKGKGENQKLRNLQGGSREPDNLKERKLNLEYQSNLPQQQCWNVSTTSACARIAAMWPANVSRMAVMWQPLK